MTALTTVSASGSVLVLVATLRRHGAGHPDATRHYRTVRIPWADAGIRHTERLLDVEQVLQVLGRKLFRLHTKLRGHQNGAAGLRRSPS